ncbi:peptidase M28-like protein [Gillisia sp. Hel_I_86]|uniref:M28 family peptidase n=1 Tax=Gillisia sp. Hel_I_86 TaxID=1249981 RepID=UPI00119AD8F6|nr:M28 family peptidase [Gillisia sp. Hel_I_86]TVZ25989.1 peptidase M28-like protein [Gillisia sp. Hel_I_86]
MLKKLSPLLIAILISGIVWFLFYSSMPRSTSEANIPETEFSTARAFEHVEAISKQPHFVGSPAHSLVRNYIVKTLQDLGLEVQTQEGYSLTNSGMLIRPQNILARIPGNGDGKALLLMSHYDSAGHSSFGASDAASGVAVILEGVRALLAEGNMFKNDIIVLFTDAEELGLNGADLFVNEHPWAKDAGLALNFEARGSGGNSFMLLETNSGNSKLIEDFIKAQPQFPVTNSLAYSIYKMLPNDTDLTVLREQGNINGFNFAFIDDHFDYHTANDIPANLDKETLAHQGSYLMPLLAFFKDADLASFDSKEDLIYFNLPLGKMVSYPFSWILPMLIIGFLLFFLVVVHGIFKRKLLPKSILKGVLPFFISLLGSGFLVFVFWKFCKMFYPEYGEMLNGFTYNGYYYIAFAIFLSLSISFYTYHFMGKAKDQASVFVFPLFFWLLICALTAFYLKGAAYFIIPAFFGVSQLWVMIRQKRPNLFLMLLLSLPALVLILPFVTSFPVALGLKILFVAGILTVLLFALFLPVFGYFKGKKSIAVLFGLVAITMAVIAHFKSGFNEDRPRPDSLVYILDEDRNTASWNSYDLKLDDWNKAYFGEDPHNTEIMDNAFESKYGSGFKHRSTAPVVKISSPGIVYKKVRNDGSLNASHSYSLKIAPNRKVHRMELFLNSSYNFEEFTVNGLEADSIIAGGENYHIFINRWSDRLLTYHAANADTLLINFTTKKKAAPEIVLYESSYDLLDNPDLKIKKRDKAKIPKPFVLNDAVILKKTIRLEE